MRACIALRLEGLEFLRCAGLSLSWLQAWLQARGFAHVDVQLFTDKPNSDAELLLVFAAEDALRCMQQGTCLQQLALINPERQAKLYQAGKQRRILLPLGDLSAQRQQWLDLCHRHMRPCYVHTKQNHGLAVEPGLWVSMDPPEESILNASGLLPEEQLMQLLEQRGLGIRFAESCTAGGLSERLTRLSGSSAVLDCSWVTYANAAKETLLAVDADLLARQGAVSSAVVEAMAKGGSAASIACLAISGIAGPRGGSIAKPVGTVFVGFCLHGRVCSQALHLHGSRASIRAESVVLAYAFAIRCLLESG